MAVVGFFNVARSVLGQSVHRHVYRCYATSSAVSSFQAKDVEVVRTQTFAPKPEGSTLKFGHHFSDHMLEIEWTKDGGWGTPKICPVHHFEMHPGAKCLHYATEGLIVNSLDPDEAGRMRRLIWIHFGRKRTRYCIFSRRETNLFEGMKAYRGDDNTIRMFRPMENMKRMLSTAERACLPLFDGRELVELTKKLIAIDADWVPKATQEQPSSLYIRPTLIGTEPTLGVIRSNSAVLFVLIGPVGPYYPTGMAPVKLLADPKFVRAWPGGSGGYKMGCNYAPTLAIQSVAEQHGCQQVLWLFGDDHQLTEVGAMNLFTFWVNEQGEKELVTAPLNGLVLPGITRKSLLELGQQWGEFKVTERDYTMKEVTKALKENRLLEMFGAGTACVVSPIEGILYNGEMLKIPTMSNPEVTNRCMKELLDIQYGRTPSDWVELID